jgi:hypothetical protein
MLDPAAQRDVVSGLKQNQIKRGESRVQVE